MITRAVEQKFVKRTRVSDIELLTQEGASLLFKTRGTAGTHPRVSSADPSVVNLVQLQGDTADTAIEGRLQLDILTPTTIRVRYREGLAIDAHHTEMIDDLPAGITDYKQESPTTGAYIIRTSQCHIHLFQEVHAFGNIGHLRIEIRDTAGKKVCGIGGKERCGFGNWDALNTGLARVNQSDAVLATECFDLGSEESIYGFGEKFGRLNKVGQTIDLNMQDGLGVTSPRTYKNIPFFVSSGGYGVFFNHSSLMSFHVGTTSSVNIQAVAEDDFLDYFVFTGSIPEVLAQYTAITGTPGLPPKWTFGYWQSKISYRSAEETLEIARQLRAHEIPCDVIHLDTDWFKGNWYCDLKFDKERFPDPAAYMAELAAMGFKVSLWQLPYIPEGSQLFNDLQAVDGFVKTADGAIYDNGMCFTPDFKGIVGVIDFTNPAATKIYQDYLRELFKLGAKVIKTDFGEDAPYAGVYHDGRTGKQLHNLYPLLYNEAAAEVTREVTGDAVVWARSAWAGGQRYPIHWGGDNSPNFENLVPQISGGLSLGLSGFPFWSQDIGGFMGETTDEILARWFPLGMFLSHSRIHGGGDREVYKFTPQTMAMCKQYLELRYRLMPYIWGTARDCVQRSLPMARALVVEFQHDRNTHNLADQWLFGRDLLVAPICHDGDAREVYLPEGHWTDWWTGQRHTGQQWIAVTAPAPSLPLFIREGAIIPLGPVCQHTDEARLQPLELIIAPWQHDGATTFTIPDDTGDLTIDYRCHNGSHTITTSRPVDIVISVREPSDSSTPIRIQS